MNNFKKILPFFIIIMFLSACNGKIPGADARKIPYDPNERVKRNLEQGKGFRIDESFRKKGSGTFKYGHYYIYAKNKHINFPNTKLKE